MKETYRINRSHGAGGFLCPPMHPCHKMSIEGIYNPGSTWRDPDCVMSLESDDIPKSIQDQVMNILDVWNVSKPSIESNEVQVWIDQVFRHLNRCWDIPADKRTGPTIGDFRTSEDGLIYFMPVYSKLGPMLIDNIKEFCNKHNAGLLFIRRYYPEFVPSATQLINGVK